MVGRRIARQEGDARDLEAAGDVAHVDDDEGLAVGDVLLRLHYGAPAPVSGIGVHHRRSKSFIFLSGVRITSESIIKIVKTIYNASINFFHSLQDAI